MRGVFANTSSNISSTNGGTGNTASDTLVVAPVNPRISLLKQVSPSSTGPWSSFLPVDAGTTVYYRFTVSNDGDVPLTPVSVTDPLVSTAGCAWMDGDGNPLSSLSTLPVATAANNLHVAVCSNVSTTASSGSHPNTATALGTYNTTTVNATSTATYATPGLSLVKSVTETFYVQAGDLLHYSYLVTNNGFVRLLGPVSISDDKATAACPAVTTVGNLDDFLDPGESVTCTATYTITPADITARSVTNTASASADGITSPTDSETVSMLLPDLTVLKTNDVSGTIPQFGTFNWTIVVSNIGTASANYLATQQILTDALPGFAGYYPQGALAVTNGATPPTGTINCSITGTSLTCDAGTAVTLPAGSAFSVSFAVTPTVVGSLSNTSIADPDNLVDESNETNNSSTNAVTVTAIPSYTISKQVSTSPAGPWSDSISVLVGAPVYYQVSVDNTGEVDLTGVTVNDPACTLSGPGTSDVNGDTILNPSETWIYTCSVNAAAGLHTNTATADTNETDPPQTDNANYTGLTPSFTIAKESATTATGPWGESVTVNLGASVYFRVQLHNNGTADLTGITVDDGIADCTLAGPGASDTNGDSILNPGETWEYTCSISAVGGSHTNTASADTDQTTSQTDTASYYGMEPSLSIDKSHTDSFVRGSTASYSLLVSNASGVGISQTQGTITVSDSLPAGLTLTGAPAGTGWSCTGVVGGNIFSCTRSDTLAPGASFPVITITVNVLESAVDPVTNTATVSGGGDPTDSSDSDITPITSVADLSLYKSVDNATPDVLSNVVYTISVYNGGPSNATGVTVQDLLPAGLIYVSDDSGGAYNPATGIWNVGSILYGNLSTLHITATVTGTTSIVNWAEVWTSDAFDPNSTPGNNSTDEDDDDSATINPQSHPSLTIGKNGSLDMTVVAPGTRADAGDVINYTITVTNTGNVPLTNVYVSDPLLSDIDCDALAPGNQNTGLTIPVSSALTCTGSYSLTQTDLNTNGGGDGDIDNTATTDSTQTSPQSASASVPFTLVPQVTADKTASPTSIAEPGGSVTFTYQVQNTGNVTLTITNLSDDIYGVLAGDTDCQVGTVLLPGATCDFTSIQTVSGIAGSIHTNVFTVQAQDGLGNTSSDTDDATVTITDVLPDISVTKSVNPLSVPETGGNATFTYTVINNATVPATITTLSDVPYGVLSGDADCQVGTVLAASASCSFDAVFAVPAGDFPGTFTDTFTASVRDGDGNTDSASDDATVTYTDVLPDIAVTKSANPVTIPETGGNVDFTYTVTNNSAESASITILSDDQFGALTGDADCQVGTVLSGSASCSFTTTFPVPAGSVPGSHTDVFTTTVNDGDGNTDSASDDATVTYTDVLPTVTLDKSVDIASLPEPGGTFTFTLTITNTSVEPVTISALTDTNALSPACNALVGTSLAPAATTSCTYTTSHTDAGTYPNTASVTVTDNEGSSASDSDSQSVSVTNVDPSIDLVKSVTPASRPEPGGTFDFTLTITNNSVEQVTISALTDTNTLSPACNALVGTSLAPAASTSCTYSVTHTDAGTYPNTASVTVTDNEGNPASDSDSQSVSVTNTLPTVTLDKTVTPASRPEPGGSFDFTLTITNTSAEPVTITALSDDNPLPAACTNLIGDPLAAGASTSCTYSVTHTDAGTYPNTASVTVEDNEGSPASANDGESVTVTDVLPTVTLDKSVDIASLPEPGGTFTFTLTITNTSVEPVTISALTDTNALSPACNALVGTSLAPAATTSCTYTTSHTDAGTYPNTASVTVTDNEGSSASDSDSQSVSVTNVDPSIDLVKSVTPASRPEPGGTFDFTLTITNNSVEQVTISALTDTNTLSPACNALVGTSLAPAASTSCTYSVTHTDAGTYPNTASVTVTDNEGNPASDSDSQSVSVTNTLPTVTLDKTVTPASRPEPGGSFDFTLTITNTSAEPVTITALSDDNPLPAACTNLIGDPLAAGASTSCTYSVTHTDAGTYPNTASVTVEDNEGSPASANDGESVTVTDVLPTVTLDKSVDIASLPEPGGTFTFTLTITNTSVEPVTISALTDTNALSPACNALVGTSLAPAATTSCTYTTSHTDAGTYPNTASVTVTDNEGSSASDSDSQSVSVTDELPVVVLTKSATPATLPMPGGDFTFTLVIANNALEDFIITSLIDSNSASTDFSACLALIGDTLAADSTVSCTYVVNHPLVGTYDNTASVTVTDNEGNSVSDSDSETVEVIDVIADLSIEKSDSPDPVGVNQDFSYSLSVTNLGTDGAINLSVVDDLPATVTFVSASGTGWVCNYDGPTHAVTCTRAALAVGAAPDITITVTAPSAPETLQNTATVSARSSDPNPNNNTAIENTLVVQSDPNAVVKTLYETDQPFTSGTETAIGEVLTYQVVINVPAGTFINAQLVDTLDQGLAFIACDTITPAAAGLTASSPFADICANPTVSEYPSGSSTEADQGRQVTYDFGNLINSTTNDIALTLTYRVVVLNSIDNQQDATPSVSLNNSAVFTGDTLTPISDSAEPVSIVEPDLAIQKTASPTFVRVGDTVTYTITIRHTSASQTDAFDTLLQDEVPAELGIILATLNCDAGGQNADSCTYDAGTSTVSAVWSNFSLTGGTGVVRFQATVLSLPPQGGVTNTANVEWTSLPGTPEPSPISEFNVLSTERYYDPGDPANSYGVEASFTLNALSRRTTLPATGFAPGVVTDISKVPLTIFTQNGDLALEIPSIKLSLPILGIPLQNGTWDLTWLSKQAGWLQGTSYPTLDGNSVLTAHVYLPNGQAGPFIDLGKLAWGQEVAIVTNGLRYIYQVREVGRVNPNDMTVFRHEEKPWITLLTCKEYDEKTNSYRSRLVVRAVLMSVEELTR